MKICFIDWFAYSLFNPKSKIVFGGAQIQLYLLARELAGNKNNQIYFLTDNHQINRIEKLNKIIVHQFLRRPWLFGYWQFFIRLWIQLKKINAQFFIQRAASAETGLIALICKLLKKQFIFMVAHEQDVNGKFITTHDWRGKLFWIGLILAEKIICQTKDQQQKLPENLKKKSVILAPAYPLKPISSLKKVNKEGILWVARAETWKNPELFLDLVARFPHEKFTMICPPAENNPDYFKIVRIKAELLPNLKFIPWVPFNQIDTFFKKSQLFISTSLSEGFPNTFIQSSQNMTPIISYQVNPDNIIDKYQLGFCANGNKSLMIKLIKRALTNHRLRQRFSLNAFNYVKQQHDLQKASINLIKFLSPDKRFSKNPIIA